jgi:hypothetical protein
MARLRRHDQYRTSFRSLLPMNRNEDKQAYPVLGAADWISLAAAPTFAIMALLTGVFGGAPSDMLCSAAQGASPPLSGMVPMYLLMSAFHLAPWLKLILSRRSIARRSGCSGFVTLGNARARLQGIPQRNTAA